MQLSIYQHILFRLNILAALVLVPGFAFGTPNYGAKVFQTDVRIEGGVTLDGNTAAIVTKNKATATDLVVHPGNSTAGDGAALNLTGGLGTTNGGSVNITGGAANVAGAGGGVAISSTSGVGSTGDVTLTAPTGGKIHLVAPSGARFDSLTVSTVPYLDASKALTSSAVTPTELGYLSGVTSGIQAQIDSAAGARTNFLLNADFRFHQSIANASAVADGGYGPDQWYGLDSNGGSSNTFTIAAGYGVAQGTEYTPNYVEFKQSNASAKQIMWCQPIEFEQSIRLKQKTVTLAFYAKTTSSQITTLRACIGQWAGTADSITRDVVSSWAATPTWIANFTCANTPADITITNSWAQYSTTATTASGTNNFIACVWTPNAEAQNDTFNISQPQLVIGSTALSWPFISKTYAQDLLEVQRFYEKSYTLGTTPATSTTSDSLWFSVGKVTDVGGWNTRYTLRYKAEKPFTPSFSYWDESGNASRWGWIDASGSQTDNVNSTTSTVVGKSSTRINVVAVQNSTSYGFHYVIDSRL